MAFSRMETDDLCSHLNHRHGLFCLRAVCVQGPSTSARDPHVPLATHAYTQTHIHTHTLLYRAHDIQRHYCTYTLLSNVCRAAVQPGSTHGSLSGPLRSNAQWHLDSPSSDDLAAAAGAYMSIHPPSTHMDRPMGQRNEVALAPHQRSSTHPTYKGREEARLSLLINSLILSPHQSSSV